MKPGSCQIYLMPDARRRAAEALYPIPRMPDRLGEDVYDYTARALEHAAEHADKLKAREDFTGPHFKDCVSQINFDDGFVHVTLTTDFTTYSYPMTDVARVKSYRSPE